jgi:hypothetical protein
MIQKLCNSGKYSEVRSMQMIKESNEHSNVVQTNELEIEFNSALVNYMANPEESKRIDD